MPGQQLVGYTGEVVIAVSGSSATIANLCFSGTGTIPIQGESAPWIGTLTCAPQTWGERRNTSAMMSAMSAKVSGWTREWTTGIA